MLNKIKFFIRSKLLPNSLFLINCGKLNKNIYLTFDDGPHPTVTQKLLNLLEKHNAKATFFVVGESVNKYPEIVQCIHQHGHGIANHSYSHPRFDLISIQDKIKEIDKTNKAIFDATQIKNSLFRAPQGRWDIKLLWYMFRNNITAVHWSRDSMDFKKSSSDTIIQNFKNKQIESGEIILFHDDNELCIDVLDTLIPWWQSQGFNIKALNTVQ